MLASRVPVHLEAAHKLASALSALRPEASHKVQVHPLTPDGRSWVLHAERWWPLQHDGGLETMWKARPSEPTRGMIMGRPVDFPRRTCAYGVDYKYTGQTQFAQPIASAPEPVQELVTKLRAVDSLGDHNALLLNWYEASLNEYMGPHSDDERELVRLAPIVSLSWCSSGHFRRFRFTARKGCSDALLPSWSGGQPGMLRLTDGCLVVMGGECQATHKHEVMKTTKRALGENEGRRINLTLRAFAASAESASRKRQREAGSSPPAAAQCGPLV